MWQGGWRAARRPASPLRSAPATFGPSLSPAFARERLGRLGAEGRRRDRKLVAPSRRRTPVLAKDRRGIPAGCFAVPRISRRTSWWWAFAQGACRADAGGRARLHGGAPSEHHRQPLADALARRNARLRPLPRTQR